MPDVMKVWFVVLTVVLGGPLCGFLVVEYRRSQMRKFHRKQVLVTALSTKVEDQIVVLEKLYAELGFDSASTYRSLYEKYLEAIGQAKNPDQLHDVYEDLSSLLDSLFGIELELRHRGRMFLPTTA